MDVFAFREELVAEYERRILDRGDSRHAGPPGGDVQTGRRRDRG